MDMLEAMKNYGCERLSFARDANSGLQAVIAIHSTQRGPALGGCRMHAYASGSAAAADALRLARGMTYKSAMAGLPYGGGKAVIVGDPGTQKSKARMRAFGRFVESMAGRYITGVDLGTDVADMDRVALETRYVTDQTGSLCATGNLTAEMTAYGVFIAMLASVKEVFGVDTLAGRTVAVQGLGKVGTALCRYIHGAGAALIVADPDDAKVRHAAASFGALPVSPALIYEAACDIFAPCAFGGVLHDASLPKLRCRIVAGAANNQLERPEHGDRLEALGILYAPDYVINAGGVITTAVDLEGGTAKEAAHRVEAVYGTLRDVFREADLFRVSTAKAADRIVERLLARP
ncbi:MULTISPECIES: Leu/Phe/Val dehydrogenase [Paenibacillus]|uniref:Leu/Phe/Val dehydrogenase n=1 Tax=Paenibacillus TaxID=44249 RepID=UPI0022B93D6C|nr:Glu/Leu/Phe/Val dehydrogenase dimerization domain-containing protein [Paenibacillus caseinilyticus]MCZ8521086.1 amino acid dehydrogenase [Paenibacillus caseinilyticus]